MPYKLKRHITKIAFLRLKSIGLVSNNFGVRNNAEHYDRELRKIHQSFNEQNSVHFMNDLIQALFCDLE